MKKLGQLFLFTLFITAGCSVVVEESTDADSSEIDFERTFPNSAIDVNTYLLGGAERTWTTLEFTIDGINGFQNCRLDDKIELKADQTYSYDGGEMLCGAEDDQKHKSGVWSVDSETRTLTFDAGTDQESIFYIESLNEEEIVVSSQYYSWKVLGRFTHE